MKFYQYLIAAALVWVAISSLIGRFCNPTMTEAEMFLNIVSFACGRF